MSTISDYELSRKYFFYHKDGLLDIFIGLGILLAGAALWAEMAWMGGVWIAIFLPIWISARKSITYRRSTDIDPQEERNTRFALAMAGLMGLLLLGVLVGLAFGMGFERMPSFRAFLDVYIHLVFGVGIALFLLFSAAIMRLPRFYAYAVLTLAIFAIGQPLAWPFWISMVVAGGLISLCGLFVLGHFLQAHPIMD
jgi:hypothetical protein